MDYEKEYKNLVAKVKNAYLFAQTDSTKKVLEDILPELRESEDERIRKALIELLKEVEEDETYTGRQHIPEMLAYLEKQKEQKSLNISAASEWLRKHVCTYMNSEYNEFHKCVEYDGSIDKEKLINDFEEAMLKEPQPAGWSAEDEKMLTGIIERGSSQIPSHEPALREEQMEWLMKRLRFLRPQPHWKPSEEQMEALSDAWLACDDKEKCELLSSLYDDLKKLM